ncbi:MAG: glucoamylase family protein, partial [Candidatus Kryptoniota bacterium]
SDSVWGLTACDGPPPSYYTARGGPPGQNDDGTIAPTAAAGSIPFTPQESIAALRAMYNKYRTRLATPYGFADAFNPTKGWFDDHNIGIDQGPIAIMIENYRTGKVWSTFMKNASIQMGLKALYFSPVTEVKQNKSGFVPVPYLFQNYPNPFNPTTTVQYIITEKSHVIIRIYDVLGRKVDELYNGLQLPGTYSTLFNATNYPSGVYFCSLDVDGLRFVQKMILTK